MESNVVLCVSEDFCNLLRGGRGGYCLPNAALCQLLEVYDH